jgi:hypothetical protein
MAMGGNPIEELASIRPSTVGALCDRFFEAHVIERCKPSTAAEYRRCHEHLRKTSLGRVQSGGRRAQDISAMHYKLRQHRTWVTALLGVLSKMFNL